MKTFLALLFSILILQLAQANVGKKGAALDSKSTTHEHMVLNFNPGMTALSAADQTKLTTFINDAKAKGKIDEIEIAVWSDKNFPAKGSALSKTDQQLADKRGDNLEDLIEDKMNIANVEVFNMAEKTNWLARAFNTEEAELKSMFMREGEAPITHEEYLSIKNSGAPQKAVILVKYDVETNRTGTSGAGTTDLDLDMDTDTSTGTTTDKY